MDFAGLYHVDHKKKKNKTVAFLSAIALPSIIIITIVFFVQLAIRKLLIFPVKISTNSMVPAVAENSSRFFYYPQMDNLKKGDIIFSVHDNIPLFCRIAGIEGDAVQMVDKTLFVNHSEEKRFPGKNADRTVFPESVSHRDNSPEFLVGPQQYFCLNDNRENLHDSRTWGPLSFSEIRGKVAFP